MARSGDLCLTLHPDIENRRTSVVRQFVQGKGTFAGKSVRLSVAGMSSEKGMLRLVLRYKVDGQDRHFGVRHPGDGTWRTLSVDQILPQGTDPDFIEILVVLQPEATRNVFVDTMSYSLENR